MNASTGYLVLYNFFMTLGWSFTFIVSFAHFVVDESYIGMYDACKVPLYIFQTGAVLEIVHAAVGMVRSNPVITALQVYSRVFLVWGICHSFPQIQNTVAVPMFLFAWSVTEIIRYSYYTYGLLGASPAVLVWCRYTLFIILYPIGVTGELLTIYWALPAMRESGRYSLPMPNSLNFGFDYASFCILTMISYIPVFPQLYLHMFAQRKKIIGGATKKTE